MSFSDELKAFRTDPASRRIVERWLEFAGIDDIWEKVLRAEDRHLKKVGRSRAERMSPGEFIQVVLSARYGVGRLIAHESTIKEKFEELKGEFSEWILAADSPREIDDAISEFKPKFELLDRAIYDWHASTPVSRKDQNGSRTRKAFAVRMRSFFLRRCGKEMDDVMTELLDIVFGDSHTKDGHTKDHARVARRPSTKAGRGR